ncbi:hypothetical protein SCLCIDRAFT_96607, partial [Scleroderma citrinum Foug A]
LPDMLYLKIHTLKSAHSQWESLATEFEQRSGIVAIELHRKLQGLRCGDKADVRAHFSKMELIHVLLAGEDLNPSKFMELFDSGTSRYMSSYRNQFINYKAIVPKSITAADNHTFQAIGKGDLMI